MEGLPTDDFGSEYLGEVDKLAGTFNGLTEDYKKSSRSNGNGGSNCLEGRAVETEQGLAAEIQDSKDPGPSLIFGYLAWTGFLKDVRAGTFDLPQQ